MGRCISSGVITAAAKNAGANVEPQDYIEDAFRYAAEARANLGLVSSQLKLMINEYNTELPGKRANLIRIINDLRAKLREVQPGYAGGAAGCLSHHQPAVADRATASRTAIRGSLMRKDFMLIPL